MSADHSLPLQKALIAGLKANPDIAADVADRVVDHALSTLRWPFIKYGESFVSPYDPQCVSGGAIEGSIHIFSRPENGLGRLECGRITANVFSYLSGLMDAGLVMEKGALIALIVKNSTVYEDPDEEGAWCGVVRFDAITGEDP